MSTKTKIDYDYTTSKVAQNGRKSNLSMFMIMLGFTCLAASSSVPTPAPWVSSAPRAA